MLGMNSSFPIFQFFLVSKDLDFTLSDAVVRCGNIVSKVFDIFLCDNKNQIIILIKLRKLYKQFTKKSMFMSQVFANSVSPYIQTVYQNSISGNF